MFARTFDRLHFSTALGDRVSNIFRDILKYGVLLSFDCGPGLEKFGTFRLDGEAFAQDFLVWTNGM